MKTYKKPSWPITGLKVNKAKQGEPLEIKIARMLTGKETIPADVPLIYTERKDGVLPEYDIRTDRHEIAIDAMDKVSKSYKHKREERHKPKEKEDPNKPIDKEGAQIPVEKK